MIDKIKKYRKKTQLGGYLIDDLISERAEILQEFVGDMGCLQLIKIDKYNSNINKLNINSEKIHKLIIENSGDNDVIDLNKLNTLYEHESNIDFLRSLIDTNDKNTLFKKYKLTGHDNDLSLELDNCNKELFESKKCCEYNKNYKSMLEYYESDIEKYKNSNTEKQNLINTLNITNKNLEIKNNNNINIIDENEKEINELKQKLFLLNSQKDRNQVADTINDTLTESDSGIIENNRLKRELEENVKYFSSEISKLNEILKELNNKNTELIHKNNGFTRENNSLTRKNNDLEDENIEIKNKLDNCESKNTNLTTMIEKLNNYKRKNTLLTTENKSMKEKLDKCDGIEKEFEIFKKNSISEINTFKKILIELQNIIDPDTKSIELQNIIDDLKKKLETCVNKINIVDSLQKDINEIKEENAILKDKNTELATINKDLIDKLSEQSEIFKEINKNLNKINTDLIDKNNELNYLNNELTKQNNELTKQNNELIDKNNELMSENTKLNQDNSSLGGKIKQLKKQVNFNWDEKYKLLNKEKDNLLNQIKKLVKEKSDLTSVLEKSNQENRVLISKNSKCNDTIKENALLIDKNNKLNDLNTELTKQINEIKTLVNFNWDEKYKLLNEEKDNLLNQINTTKEKELLLTNKITILEQKITGYNSLNEVNKKLVKEKSDLTSVLEKLNQDNSSLGGKIKQLEQVNFYLNKEYRVLISNNSKCDDTLKENSILKEKYRTLNEQLEIIKQEYNDKVINLHSQINMLMHEKEDLVNQLRIPKTEEKELLLTNQIKIKDTELTNLTAKLNSLGDQLNMKNIQIQKLNNIQPLFIPYSYNSNSDTTISSDESI